MAGGRKKKKNSCEKIVWVNIKKQVKRKKEKKKSDAKLIITYYLTNYYDQ